MIQENREISQDNLYEIAVRSIELPFVAPEFAQGSLEFIRIGKMEFGRASWGRRVSNDEILEAYSRYGLYNDELSKSIKALGFSGGYRISPEVDGYKEEFQNLHAYYISSLVHELVRKRGWESLDVLAVASSTCANWVPERAKEMLKGKGISVGKAILYAQACNGTIAAISDINYDENYKKARCGVVGIDTLSTLADPRNPITYCTFGNGIAGCVFTAHEDFKIKYLHTLIDYSPEGPIRGMIPYTLPQNEEGLKEVYWWYEFENEISREHFAQTPMGDTILDVPRSSNGFIVMDGLRTFTYFVEKVPDVALKVWDWYIQNYSNRRGNFRGIQAHQPSAEVTKGLNKMFAVKYLMSHLKMQRGEAFRLSKDLGQLGGILKQRGVEYPEIPRVDWVMDKTGFNNISAGTALVALMEKAKRGENLFGDHFLLGFGIGSAITASIAEISE